MLTVPTDEFHLPSESDVASGPRAAWRQRVHRLIERFLAPYEDLTPHLFATEEYLQLTGSVRRSRPHGLSSFDESI